MQTAKGTLRLNGCSTIEVAGVTPAEAAILQKAFVSKKGGLENMEYTGEVEGTGEPARLIGKYAKGQFSKAFPGESPRLPQTFAEVKVEVKGVPVAKPTPK